MTLSLALKATVPAAFFGYAIAANLTLFNMPDTPMPVLEGVFDGKITHDIDTLYRDSLPHKVPAVGLIGAARYVLLDEGRPGVVVGRGGTLFTSEEFRAPDPLTYKKALLEIAAVANDLQAQGVELLVAPLPAKVDLLRAQSPDADESRRLELFYSAFLQDLNELGIQAIDTRPALLPLSQPFLITDTHWTPEGASAVAQLIASSETLTGGTEQFSTQTDATTKFAGDLVTYVTSDALAPRIGLAPEQVTPYRAIVQATDGGVVDIFGNSAEGSEKVDLVGTSYSANPNWSFAEALKLALHRDVINYAEEGKGPFAPMQSYMTKRDPLDGAAQVIWEIPVRYLTDPAMLTTGAEDRV
ncbi:hypothetical protein KBW81_18005 (plasmid) [Loktanella salsilacus]|uniref:alginate O-acetyltransferase AlgX-related protein n=1 Tax=Loktanella salsilacus TaxID=195913 RepID=UPI0020B8E5B3|nr:hypothetical protein [Loktanella salsilacus]UTH50080.1 hypothetical protein KBW81_18005 [Loktanella salsilacus]